MTTMEKVYMDAQAACGLEVGDYVKIIRKADDYEAGWARYWNTKKDIVGITGIIQEINELGIYIKLVGYNIPITNCYVPYFVLEKVEKPVHEFKPFDKVLVRDCSDEKWRCNIFSHIHASDFLCVGSGCWNHCIPYEGNEHLVGTTDMPEK